MWNFMHNINIRYFIFLNKKLISCHPLMQLSTKNFDMTISVVMTEIRLYPPCNLRDSWDQNLFLATSILRLLKSPVFNPEIATFQKCTFPWQFLYFLGHTLSKKVHIIQILIEPSFEITTKCTDKTMKSSKP